MSESVYVNTDRIKFKGRQLPFVVHIEGLESSVLVSAVLRRKDGSDDCIWAMECDGGDGVKDFDVGKVDAYVAGLSLGKPLLLKEVVELKDCKELECIPQAHDMENYIAKELETVYIEEFVHRRIEGFTAKEEEILAEEGELSWFNAGVRLGIGLGVGMSLGVGVGLGLIIKTYKSTSGVLRKLLA